MHPEHNKGNEPSLCDTLAHRRDHSDAPRTQQGERTITMRYTSAQTGLNADTELQEERSITCARTGQQANIQNTAGRHITTGYTNRETRPHILKIENTKMKAEKFPSNNNFKLLMMTIHLLAETYIVVWRNFKVNNFRKFSRQTCCT
jgi:ABC-type sulfate transport system substrate-binding protein